MRALLVLLSCLLALVGAAEAEPYPRYCVTEDGDEVACVYSDEPLHLACVDVNGNTVACVRDPCGTTSCGRVD